MNKMLYSKRVNKSNNNKLETHILTLIPNKVLAEYLLQNKDFLHQLHFNKLNRHHLNNHQTHKTTFN